MSDSIKASETGLLLIDQLRRKKGWTKDSPKWLDEAGGISRSTLQRFWKPQPIRQESFKAICKAVNFDDWASIVDEPMISELLKNNIDQRLKQAKRILIVEILSNITHLDARLGFVDSALAKDTVKKKLESIRSKATLARNQVDNLGYHHLIVQQSIPALRQALNSRPLKTEAGISMIEVLATSKTDPQPVKTFYEHLTDVQDVSESLMGVLSEAASMNLTDQQKVEHHQNRMDLEVHKLHNRSLIAHLSGLIALNHLGGRQLSLDYPPLKHLQYLEPKAIVDQPELEERLTDCLYEAQALFIRRAEMIDDGEQWVAGALQAYEKINEMLKINPTDTWGQVVDKAISLRQLGRPMEAVAAFIKYSEMFSDTDPTARQYAKIAQQMTLQSQDLGIEGGIYIYELVEDGRAQQAAIPEGAIVIDYGGHFIKDMEDLVTTLKHIPHGEPTRITYLEMDNSFTFQRHTRKIIGGSLGAGIMPI